MHYRPVLFTHSMCATPQLLAFTVPISPYSDPSPSSPPHLSAPYTRCIPSEIYPFLLWFFSREQSCSLASRTMASSRTSKMLSLSWRKMVLMFVALPLKKCQSHSTTLSIQMTLFISTAPTPLDYLKCSLVHWNNQNLGPLVRLKVFINF